MAIAIRETSVMVDISHSDFDTKLQAVPTVAAVEVSRDVLPRTPRQVSKLGYEWKITFKETMAT